MLSRLHFLASIVLVLWAVGPFSGAASANSYRCCYILVESGTLPSGIMCECDDEDGTGECYYYGTYENYKLECIKNCANPVPTPTCQAGLPCTHWHYVTGYTCWLCDNECIHQGANCMGGEPCPTDPSCC